MPTIDMSACGCCDGCDTTCPDSIDANADVSDHECDCTPLSSQLNHPLTSSSATECLYSLDAYVGTDCEYNGTITFNKVTLVWTWVIKRAGADQVTYEGVGCPTDPWIDLEIVGGLSVGGATDDGYACVFGTAGSLTPVF